MKYEKKITDIARDILDKKIGIIEGARRITKLRSELKLFDLAELDIFRAIESQTDHLILGVPNFPISDSRMKLNQEEIKETEQFYWKDVALTCENLLTHDN